MVIHEFSLVHFTRPFPERAHKGRILVRGGGFLPVERKSVRQNGWFFVELEGFSIVSSGYGKQDVENERVTTQGIAGIIHKFSSGFPQKWSDFWEEGEEKILSL